MKKITLRGIDFDNVTMEEAVALAEKAMEENRQTAVFTPNAEIAQLAAEDPEIQNLFSRADLILPDGAGIVLASEIMKTPLKEKVAGVDFGEQILALASKKDYSVFLLGGKPGIAALAAQRKKQSYPGLTVAGTQNGYFKKEGIENDAVLQKINESGAQILFVCFGAPAQELWIDENKSRLPSVKLFLGLGGSLDVYAGAVRRAPNIFIRARLEWLYRLLREPKRIGRMMKLPKYILGTYREKFSSRNADR
ncbi:MAG: WecB/TagA/CpsF family glycosyltransferase [Clostridia bacterium]|nr:WecB/TagA/CpsF family glycosyltransferase [Clostridia bacterium]